MRIIIYISLLFLSLTGFIYGQGAPLSTQFMFNKLAYNPAYAGSQEYTELTGIVRSQWVGFPGAPKTQQLSANIPLLDQRLGLGLTAMNHSIGITEYQTLEGSYSYRIRTNEHGYLGLGLQSSYRRYSLDFNNDNLIAIDGISIDPNIVNGSLNANSINFGGGIYLVQGDFYLGISIPRFSDTDLPLGNSDLNISEQRVFYAMTGIKRRLNQQWSITPQLLIRYVENLPWDMDANVTLTYDEFFSIGASYRHGGDRNSLGESLDLIVSVHINDSLMLGAAYDYNLTDLGRQSSGSFEGVVRYRIGAERGKIIDINPRYF